MASGATTPAAASPNVPPPLFNLQIVDSRGFPTPTFMEQWQKLWASVKGTGGISETVNNTTVIVNNLVDNELQNLTSPGTIGGSVEAALEQDPTKATIPPPGQIASIVDGILAQSSPFLFGSPGISSAAAESLFSQLPPQSMDGAKIAALAAELDSLRQMIVAPVRSPGISPSPIAWTPVLAGSTTAGTQTYSKQWGVYLEVGPLVIGMFSIALSALGGTIAGNVTITGLPILSNNSTGAQAQPGSLPLWGDITLGAGYTALGLDVAAGSNVIAVQESGSTLAPLALPVSGLSSTSILVGTIAYFR